MSRSPALVGTVAARYPRAMKQLHLPLALFFGIGCATAEAFRVATATAQPGPSRFRECVRYPLNVDGDLEDLPGEAKPIGGWTPIGGTGDTAVILCR